MLFAAAAALLATVIATAPVDAGAIVTAPRDAKKSSSSLASSSSLQSSISRSASKSSGQLKWKAPRVAGAPAAEESSQGAQPSQSGSKSSSTARFVSPEPETAAAPARPAKPQPEPADGEAASSLAIKAPPPAPAKVSESKAASRAEKIATTLPESPRATGSVSRVEIIQTALQQKPVDPFGDEAVPQEKPAAPELEKKADEAGVQPGREGTPLDPFPEDPSLKEQQDKPKAADEPPGILPYDEEKKLAQKGYDKPCPKPSDIKPLSQIDASITPEGTEFPTECMLSDAPFAPRSWSETTYTWKASGLCHKPLYFEERALERYGHTCSPLFQPLISGAHFFGSAIILPYKMGLETPCECIYPLGDYRVGSCAPYMIQPLPISLRGAVYQTGTVLGMVYLIP